VNTSRAKWMCVNSSAMDGLPSIALAYSPLQEEGAELATLPEDRVAEGSDWAKVSGRWTSHIDKHIALLERLRARSHPMHRVWLPFTGPMPARNGGDRAASLGSCPRYWVSDPRRSSPEGAPRDLAPQEIASDPTGFRHT
jgi:hypothetical protein